MKYSNEEMKAKWAEFEKFLDQVNVDYADELKLKGNIRNYIAYGNYNNDIICTPDRDAPPQIAKLVRAKIKEIFP